MSVIKILMTPAEVIRTAFRQAEAVSESMVSETVVLTAQEKFIRPVLGGLYDRMLEGAYPELLEEYVKAPLALYVKLLVMPALAVQAGAMGIVQAKGANFQAAAERQQALVRRQVRADALALMRRAVAHIEASPECYPEYDSRENILNRVSVDGGAVIEK